MKKSFPHARKNHSRLKFSFSVWKFHSRLKISISGLVFRRPERGSEWKHHSRLKMSFRIESLIFQSFRKGGGVQKSMGNKVPWKTGMLIYFPVTSWPLISLQKEASLSPCIFATTHLTACILNFYLPWTSRPMKPRTLHNAPILPLEIDFFNPGALWDYGFECCTIFSTEGSFGNPDFFSLFFFFLIF